MMLWWDGLEKQLKPLSYIILDGTQGGSFFKLDFPVQSFLIYSADYNNPSKPTNDVLVSLFDKPSSKPNKQT